MIKKYNLALIPSTKSKEIIKFAQNFKDLTATYLVGAHSIPHVTLRHFHAEEGDIETIWQRACHALQSHQLQLEFAGFGCITFNKQLYWISLLPDHIEQLHQMHRVVAEVIGIALKQDFDPHLSLLNTLHSDCKKDLDKYAASYTVIADTFYLSLGKCDEVGQYTEIIYSSE